LKQKASLEQIVQQHHQQNKSNDHSNNVSSHTTHHDNVVVQRGYNNDYIVPMNGTSFLPSVTTGYSVRRTSPVVLATPNVPRFSASNLSNTVTTSEAEYRLNSQQQVPMATGAQVTLPRKPPPDYASIQRTSSDNSSDDTPQREVVSIDADFMRKMTQKYCEPRLRKNPPPSYKTAVTSYNNDANLSFTGENVILRHENGKRTANRSRPHSYTETGVLVYETGTRKPAVVTNMTEERDDEKRKHPKRTHSMPAVKQSDMRPVAAQAFLNDQSNRSNDLSQQQQQQLPPSIQLTQQFSRQEQQLSPQPSAVHQYQVASTTQQPSSVEQQNQQQQATDQTTVAATSDTTQQHLSAATTNNPYQQSPKKTRTRQQRAEEESFNRRKSIDSGTLQKLAEEMYENPVLGGEYPILSQLLGESQFSASERRSQGLYRYKSTEALYSQF